MESFQILKLSAVSRLSHPLRIVPPSITHQAAADNDALVEWTLASILAGTGAAAAGLPNPEEEVHGPIVFQNQTCLGHEPYGRPTCPSEKAVSDLPAAIPFKAQTTSVATPLSWVVSSLPPPGGIFHPSSNGWPERLMASAFLSKLKTVDSEVKMCQMDNAMGVSWTTLAAEKNPQG